MTIESEEVAWAKHAAREDALKKLAYLLWDARGDDDTQPIYRSEIQRIIDLIDGENAQAQKVRP